MSASRVAALLIVFSGCSTVASSGARGFSDDRAPAGLAVSSVFPRVSAEEMRAWDCKNYLDLYHPSGFRAETVRDLNLSKFSVSTAIDGFSKVRGVSLANLVSGGGNVGEKFVDYPWLSDLALFPKTREAVYEAIVRRKLGGDLDGFFGDLAKAYETSGKADWAEAASRIEGRAKELESLKMPNETSDVTLLGLCGFYVSISRAPDCMRSIKRILDEMLPQDPVKYVGAPVTLIPVLKEYLSDPRNFPVLLGINRDLADLVRAGSPSGTDDLFGLIERNYRKSGFSPEEAYDRAWTFMGIYSTSGGNIAQRIEAMLEGTALDDRYRISAGFSHFAMAVSVLDARAYFNGNRFFSMPRNVENSVNNGKVYHFWMSAYLARKNVRLGRSEMAAGAAAWIAQLGYQMKSTTAGHAPARAFYTEAFGPANNKIRLDLAYAANGAIFGAQSSKALSPHPYSIDETLRNLLASGEDLPPLPQAEAESLAGSNGIEFWNRWNRVFSPKKAFVSVRESAATP